MEPPLKDLDHYQLQELLGEGGMAKVWKALDTRLQRTVAIKILTHETLLTPRGEARFQREARLAASLRHPNIVTVYDCSPAGSAQNYLVTELVRGGSLRHQISPDMLAEEAALLLLPVARALGAAHKKGIVHRDVKPDNILIDHEQGITTIKLADFGVALDAAVPRLTTDGAISGSVHYMAPEQIKEGLALPASDIWSVGVTLLEMIRGQHPFSGLTLGQIVEQVLAGRLPHSEEDMPLALQQILTRCLQVDPAGRFANGDQLAEALERALESWGLMHPQEEIQRWSDEQRHREHLAERLADHLIQRAVAARSLTDRANLLDRALLLVPHHEKALALLAPPENTLSPTRAHSIATGALHAQNRTRTRWWIIPFLIIGTAGLFWLLRAPAAPHLPPSPPLKPERIMPPPTQGPVRAPNFSAHPGQRPDAAPTAPDLDHRSRWTKTLRAAPTPKPQRTAPQSQPPLRPLPSSFRRDDAQAGALVLTTQPWAEVILDGESLGFTPSISKIPLSPGDHRLLLRSPHCEPTSLKLTLNPGEILVRTVKLKLLPARVKVEAPTGWTIFVDGSKIGPAPLPPLNLAHGSHQVEARDSAGKTLQRTVQAVAGKLVTLQLKEQR